MDLASPPIEMTHDFAMDAAEILEKNEDAMFILFYCDYGSSVAHSRANIPSKQHLEWMRDRIDDMLETIEADLPECCNDG